MESIIGKRYIARDTSYMINLTNPQKDFRLAGIRKIDPLFGIGEEYEQNPIPVMIVSEPYDLPKESMFSDGFETKIHKFVNVTHMGYVISVLFYPEGIID